MKEAVNKHRVQRWKLNWPTIYFVVVIRIEINYYFEFLFTH